MAFPDGLPGGLSFDMECHQVKADAFKSNLEDLLEDEILHTTQPPRSTLAAEQLGARCCSLLVLLDHSLVVGVDLLLGAGAA